MVYATTNGMKGAAHGRTAIAPLLRAILALLRCDSAAIGPLTALMLIPICGAIAYSVELGSWQYMQRSMQNAADSAAIAAATVDNAGTTGTTSLLEAKAAAAKYGFIDGTNDTTVTAAPATCPAGVATGATCYQATVSTVFPLLFSRVIGFSGDSNSGNGQSILASAIATTAGGGSGSTQVCVLTLGPGNSFTSNGGPKPDMAGCTIASNGNMTCNGHNLGATYGVAAGTNRGCGVTQFSNKPAITDPYGALASNIPPNSCSSYPQEPSKKKDPALPSTNILTGSQSWSGNQIFCGDVQLSGDVTLAAGSNATVVIQNGRLDLNGHTFKTASGAAATIVFSGTADNAYSHYPTGSGTLDIQAPTSGAWSGVAVYQDPNLTNNVSFTYSGNQPTWNITGLVYLPKADVTFSGAVNKSANGSSCFVLIAYTVLVNGTAYIFANDDACAAAGLSPPTTSVGGGGTTTRERLVQ